MSVKAMDSIGAKLLHRKRISSISVNKILSICSISATVLLSGCGDTKQAYIFPSPDDSVSLWLDATLGGGAAGSSSIDVYIKGKSSEHPAYIGTLFHYPNSPLGWTGENTFNICEFGYRKDAKKSYEVVGFDGKKRSYTMTTFCHPDDKYDLKGNTFPSVKFSREYLRP